MSKFNINKDKIIEKIKSEKVRYIGIAAGIIMVAATSTGLVASMKMDKPVDNVVAEDEIVDVVSEIMTEAIPDATVGTTVTSNVTTTKKVVTTSLLTTLNTTTAGMIETPTIMTTITLPEPKQAPKQVENVEVPTTTVNTTTVSESTTSTETTVTTTAVETTVAEETTTTTSEPEDANREYTVYKPSTHYVHRNTCHWCTDECYEIQTTEGLEARYCTECNPDIEIVTAYQVPTPTLTSLQYVTEEERVYLCNTVAYEYGSDWVPLYDKACVVATVMNRVRDGGWTNGLPSTVYNVLTAPYQYNPVYATPYYSYNVTQSCIDAVEYYFEHQSDFPHYTSFYGDGRYNYFR
jgi:hypothetical protein